MDRINRFLIPLIVFSIILTSGLCFGDERDIFMNSVNPDALILLDLSLSMTMNPAGGSCSAPGCRKLDMAKMPLK